MQVSFDSDSTARRSAADVGRAVAERDELLAVNKQRQRQIAAILEAERRHAPLSSTTANNASADTSTSTAATSDAAPVKTDYIKLLNQLHLLWDDIATKHDKAEATIRQLTEDLDDRDSKGELLASSLRQFQHSIAKSSVDRRGQPIHSKVIDKFDSDEIALNAQLAETRLSFLTFQSQLDGIHGEIKRKEQLAEGLHLIDFEQLKIENATLNEKIEERNDEIYKLKKKRNNAVEIFTHVREKIHYLRHENASYSSEISHYDAQIQTLRSQLKAVKETREALRQENEVLKIKQGFIGEDALVTDFEDKKLALKALRDTISRQERELKEWKERKKSVSSAQSDSSGGGHVRFRVRVTDSEEAKEPLGWTNNVR